MQTHIGIDPGSHGGLVALHGGTVNQARLGNMTESEIWKWFQSVREGECTAVIEKVQGYIGGMEGSSNGAGPRGASMFKFGQSYGFLRGCLIAAGIPFDEITPQTWQKGIGTIPRTKVETKTQWKGRLRQRAQQLFPHATVTADIADALLIAEYGRRVRNGEVIRGGAVG